MPFEFSRMITALVREDIPYDKAFKVAFDDFERRHDALKKEAEAAAQKLVDEQKAQQDQQQAETDAQHQHEKDIATLKKPSKPAGTANKVATPMQRVVVQGRPEGMTLQINAVNKETREISGYASVWEMPMRDHKLMSKNAFSQETIDLYLTNPVLLFNHDDSRPIGTVLELKNDDYGLFCRAKINEDEAWQMIEDGRLRAFSWMGIAKSYRWVPDQEAINSGAFHADAPGYDPSCGEEIPLCMQIDEAEVWEISGVTLPNSPQCLFEIAKAHQEMSNFSLWASIKDIEPEERMVYGYALVWGEPDADGHVILREDAEPAIEAYRRWANIREQHTAHAVGSAPVIRCDDFGLWIGAHISLGAPDCWNKIRDKTYQGFSIAGWADAWEPGDLDGHPVIFLRAITIEEISVCDRPKVAKATFSLIKRDELALLVQQLNDDSIAAKTVRSSVSTTQGGSMSDQVTETLEEKRVGLLARIVGMLSPPKPAEDTNTETLSALTQPTQMIFKLDTTGDTKHAPLVITNAAGEKVDVAGELVANAAMTKQTREDVTKLSDQMTECLKAINALANPAKEEGEEEAEGEAEANAAKKPPKKKADPDAAADAAGFSAKNALPKEVLETYQQAVKNGLSRVDAFEATAEMFGEDLDAFIGALGFPEGEEKVATQLSQEQMIACAVKAAMEPLIAQLKPQAHAPTAASSRLVRSRNSASVAAQEISGAFGDDDTAQGSFWDGAIGKPVANGRGK